MNYFITKYALRSEFVGFAALIVYTPARLNRERVKDMRSMFTKCAVVALLAALLVAAVPLTSWASGGGSAAGTTGGEGRGTERGAPPPADGGRNVGTGGTGPPAQDGGVEERRAGEGGFVGAPAGGGAVDSLTLYNGDQAACLNACLASGQYPPDQCQYMCTQW